MNIDLSNLDPAMEGFLISGGDTTHNLDKWKAGKVNILYVVGFSGSGKSTTSKELAKKHNAEHLDTDDWMVDNTYGEQIEGLVKYIKEKRKSKDKVIIEGLIIIDAFSYGEHLFDFFEDCAAIAKGTSFVTSTIRAAWRDNEQSKKGLFGHLKSRYKTNQAFLADYNRFVNFVSNGFEVSSTNDKIKIGDSKIHGKGLICTDYIQSTEMLCLAFKRIGDTGRADEDWELSENAHSINHSDNPNVTLIHNNDKSRYIFVSIKNIKKGEELTTDYNKAPDFVEKPKDFLKE